MKSGGFEDLFLLSASSVAHGMEYVPEKHGDELSRLSLAVMFVNSDVMM
jgi:hypothetical protein